MGFGPLPQPLILETALGTSAIPLTGLDRPATCLRERCTPQI
jgi:hypothetical protein